jgi:hypothetical protein
MPAYETACEYRQYGWQWFQTLIQFGSGAAVALLAGWLAVRRDAVGRRRAFRGYIKSVVAEWKSVDLGKIQPGQLFQKHQSFISGVREKCAMISEDICRAEDFESVWVSYCGLSKQDVEPPRDDYDPEKNPTALLHPNYEQGSKKVLGLLESLIDYAKYHHTSAFFFRRS